MILKEIFIKQLSVKTKQMKICSCSSEVQNDISEMQYFVFSCTILTVEDGIKDWAALCIKEAFRREWP